MPAIKSEMAGSVLAINVKVGDKVSSGQEVVVLESMKMEVPLTSTVNGTVAKILKNVGDFVNENETIIELN